MISFHIIGGGKRTEFFLRIARALPEHFRITGVLVRDAAKRDVLAQRWHVPVAGTLDGLRRLGPADFVLLAVARTAAPIWLAELAEQQTPVLTETPPAADLAGLREVFALVRAGARIQVAEQYHAQPWHAARLALAGGGRLGAIRHVQVAVAHGYHGVSLIRRYLGTGLGGVRIRAMSGELPSTATETPGVVRQTVALLEFATGTGVFEFCADQYFSPVRRPRVLVRGERGEIENRQARWLDAAGNLATVELRRVNTGIDGNPGGYSLQEIAAGGESLYRNPFGPTPLGDDELAGAAALAGMAAYAGGGPSFYSLAEATHDQYLALLIDEAATTGRAIVSEGQAWSA